MTAVSFVHSSLTKWVKMNGKETYHARASARPAMPPAIRWVLNGIFSFGAGAVGDGLAGLPSRADLIDITKWILGLSFPASQVRCREADDVCSCSNGQRRGWLILDCARIKLING